MLNYIWLGLILISVIVGIADGKMTAVATSVPKTAKLAFELALGLTGIMAFWLGLMKIAQESGLVQLIARLIRPLMIRLFPDVPATHPAMASMMLNFAANMLGLSNAATPFGLRAMHDLETLNPHPGTATNAMCTFLAINTSCVQLIPTTAIAFLAAGGASNPTDIIGTALVATSFSTIAAIGAAKFLEKRPWFHIQPKPPSSTSVP